MPLNILRHKTWHPGNAEAIERVAIDTAAAAARDAATRAAVEAADADASIAALRRRAGLPYAGPSISFVNSAAPKPTAKGHAASVAAAATTTPASAGIELAPRVPLPWYARAPGAALQQKSLHISRERSGAANFSVAVEAARVYREDARKNAEDPMTVVKEELRAISAPISDFAARAGAGGGASRKRSRADESDGLDPDGYPSLGELRKQRLQREEVEGTRASEILLSAAAAGGIPQPVSRGMMLLSDTRNAVAIAAHTALAAARRADAQLFSSSGRRISYNR